MDHTVQRVGLQCIDNYHPSTGEFGMLIGGWTRRVTNWGNKLGTFLVVNNARQQPAGDQKNDECAHYLLSHFAGRNLAQYSG
jgi:hypothetical protein